MIAAEPFVRGCADCDGTFEVPTDSQNPEKVIAARRRSYRKNRAQRVAESVERGRLTGRSAEQTRRRRRLLAEADGSFTAEEFQTLCETFEGRCAYCGEVPEKGLTTDHVVPLSKGGSNDIGNILPACRSCNASKGDDSLEDFLTRRKREEALL